jgi:hypothetical protein
MKNTLTLFVALGLLTAAVATAKNWSQEECNQDAAAAKMRAAYASAVRAAAPDTPLYSPNPFPTTDAQVFADFVAFHTSAFADTTLDAMPLEEQRLANALKENYVRYEVVDVENWTPLRCGVPKARLIWSVLRLYDATSDEELARATVDDVGHVGRLRHRPAGRSLRPIVSLSLAARAIRELALGARDAQYVATWGTLECDELNPCVAMREGGTVYLLDGRNGDLFRFNRASRRLSFRQDLAVDRRATTLTQAVQGGHRLVSLGADTFVEVEFVGAVGEIVGR